MAEKIQSVFDIRILGTDQVIRNLDSWLSATRAGLISAVRITAQKIAQKAKTALRRGKYKAIASGRLANAHRVVRVKVDSNEISYSVDNREKYSVYVHQGTRKMRKRPWLRATMLREENLFVGRVRKVLSRDTIQVTSDTRERTVTLDSGRSLSFTSIQ